MTILQFRKPRAVIAPPPRSCTADRPHAVWVRDPKTGRLIQTWVAGEDGERSCTRRPAGPPPHLRLAA